MKKDGKKGSGTAGSPPAAGESDDAVWKSLTRTVKAYTETDPKPRAPVSGGFGKKTPPTADSISPVVIDRPLSPHPATGKKTPADPGFDKGIELQLKKGKFRPERRLDLHGLTQQEALQALNTFIPAAVRDDLRTLLIITGKGRVSEEGGVLRRMVPLWLAETALRANIIAVTPARPEDGGAGALYVRLRKK